MGKRWEKSKRKGQKRNRAERDDIMASVLENIEDCVFKPFTHDGVVTSAQVVLTYIMRALLIGKAALHGIDVSSLSEDTLLTSAIVLRLRKMWEWKGEKLPKDYGDGKTLGDLIQELDSFFPTQTELHAHIESLDEMRAPYADESTLKATS